MSHNFTFVERGALFTCNYGTHQGDTYLLVRESEGVYATDATGKKIGAPQYLFNLVNLTNEGKARVSTPARKLVSPTVYVSVAKVRDHFGLDLVFSGKVSNIKPEVQAGVARLAREKAAREAAARMLAAQQRARIIRPAQHVYCDECTTRVWPAAQVMYVQPGAYTGGTVTYMF